MTKIMKDDPHDECTHWIGNLPKTDNDSTERPDKCNTRGTPEPNILSTKLGVEEKQ